MPIPCPYCGEPFAPRARDQKFCSPRCRNAAWLASNGRLALAERLRQAEAQIEDLGERLLATAQQKEGVK